MPKLINRPTTITTSDSPPMVIEEFVGERNTQESGLSVSTTTSPLGWAPPGGTLAVTQTIVVVTGMLRVDYTGDQHYEVNAGEAVVCAAGEWVRFSTPNAGGATCISVCVPAYPDS